MQHLAAAFPRAAWRQQSDAAYTMALADAGVSPDVLNRAVRHIIREHDELPAVADIIRTCLTVEHQNAPAWRCPECGSDIVSVIDGRVVLCHDCEWEVGA